MAVITAPPSIFIFPQTPPDPEHLHLEALEHRWKFQRIATKAFYNWTRSRTNRFAVRNLRDSRSRWHCILDAGLKIENA